MSPLNPWDLPTEQPKHPADAPVKAVPAPKQDSRGTTPPSQTDQPKPLRLLTEIDAIVSERIASQPQTLGEVEEALATIAVADLA